MVRRLNESSKGRIELDSFWDLKNADDLRDEIIEKLKQFDKDQNQYQTDVYIYVNDDMTGKLYDFVNVGGNSWLDDDHYVLWTDKQRYEDWSDFWNDEYEISNALGMSLNDLKQQALEWLNTDGEYYDFDDIGYQEIYTFIDDSGYDYKETLEELRCDAIDTEYNEIYSENADDIIRAFDYRLKQLRNQE